MFGVISTTYDSLQVSIESLQPNNDHGAACNGHCRIAMCVADNKWGEYSVLRGVASGQQVIAGV